MKNVTTIFNQILNLIPQSQIQKATDKFITKKFKTYHHLVTLLYAQITEKDSLRDIEHPLNISKNKMQFFSLPEVKRSTLAEANNRRNSRIFEEIFNVLLRQNYKVDAKTQV